MAISWRVIITVLSLTAVAITALILNQITIAALAGGALAGYLGRVNGAAAANSTP